MRSVTSWLHVWFGIRQEGVKPCRMVPSKKDEVREQLHDVTGTVQSARAVSCHAKLKKKKKLGKASLAFG